MILATHTAAVNTLPEIVWNFWRDVETWPSWDSSLSSTYVDGSFIVEAKGRMILTNKRHITFTIEECTPYQSFTVATKLFGATLHIEHDLKEIDALFMCATPRI